MAAAVSVVDFSGGIVIAATPPPHGSLQGKPLTFGSDDDDTSVSFTSWGLLLGARQRQAGPVDGGGGDVHTFVATMTVGVMSAARQWLR